MWVVCKVWVVCIGWIVCIVLVVCIVWVLGKGTLQEKIERNWKILVDNVNLLIELHSFLIIITHRKWGKMNHWINPVWLFLDSVWLLSLVQTFLKERVVSKGTLPEREFKESGAWLISKPAD